MKERFVSGLAQDYAIVLDLPLVCKPQVRGIPVAQLLQTRLQHVSMRLHAQHVLALHVLVSASCCHVTVGSNGFSCRELCNSASRKGAALAVEANLLVALGGQHSGVLLVSRSCPSCRAKDHRVSSTATESACRCVQRMAQGRDAWQWEGGRAARIGLIPRGTEDGRDVRWFQLPALWTWHTVNAWQEGGAVLLYACVYDSVRPGSACAQISQSSRAPWASSLGSGP